MYVHLNKKITIPNCDKVRTIAWSADHDFIACGGDGGTLKVIKLETPNLNNNNDENNNNSNVARKSESAAAAAARNFSHNQNLESHKSTVQCVRWNEPFQKLTSSDEGGSIIVWILYKGNWYEEMVNNRSKTLVTGMAWTMDGQKICIVYDDGAVITGSVDGNRIWGKEIKNTDLTKVDWSPDGKTILIGTNSLEVQILDSVGNFVRKIPLTTLQTYYGRANAFRELPALVCIRWYKMHAIEHPLIIAYEDGWFAMMRDEMDDYPMLINAELRIAAVEWNYSGDMFAVAGISTSEESGRKNCLKLYNADGELLKNVRIPGHEIFDCTWDRSGLRLALAVDSYIFFANVKPDYQWGYLTNSVVFALPNRGGKSRRLIFCPLRQSATNAEIYEKEIINFRQLATWAHCCATVSRASAIASAFSATSGDAASAKTSANATSGKRSDDWHSLTLFNSIGTLIDRHLVNLRVKHCCLNSSRMIVTSEDSFYVWQFQQPHSGSNIKYMYGDRLYNELSLQADETVSTATTITAAPSSAKLVARSDPIICLTACEKSFIVAHRSGIMNQYLLPNAVHVHRFQLFDAVPACIALNRNSSKLAAIDRAGQLHIYDFDANNDRTGKEGDWLDLQMQDVWNMRWASDCDDMLALCEKNRLTVVNSAKLEREDAIPSGAYICAFEQLRVRTIRLDRLMSDVVDAGKTTLSVNDYIDDIESQTIRELKEILDHSLTDAVNYALQWPSLPGLWNIIIERSLESAQLETAKLAMIKIKDYRGIQFVKRLSKLNDLVLKKAEICAYLGRFEEAEKIYIEQNRAELAIELNQVLGKYDRALQLLEEYQLANFEKEAEKTRTELAQQYVDHQQWEKAVDQFERVDASEQLVSCYVQTENYNGLVRLIDRISDAELLTDIGAFLRSMGLCKDSVRAFVKANKADQAVDVCVSMSEWKLAIDLAHEHHIANIDSILGQYVEHLLAERKYIEIVEVYRKANKFSDAIDILITLIGELKQAGKVDATLLKKLFVLIGLLSKEMQRKMKQTNNPSNSVSKSALDDLLTADAGTTIATSTVANVDRKMIEDPWKGAEAYHFWLLAQRHLYEGYYDLAMKAALHLQDYDEFLSPEDIYSLIALASLNCRCYTVSSKAFIKLEAISGGGDDRGQTKIWDATLLIGIGSSEIEKCPKSSNQSGGSISLEKRLEMYEKLAVEVFSANPPTEPRSSAASGNASANVLKVDCKFCGSKIADHSTACGKCNTKFLPCIASGRSIMDGKQQWTCKQCTHQAIKTEMKPFNHCPLCHFPINNNEQINR